MNIQIINENNVKRFIRHEISKEYDKKFEEELKRLWERITLLNDEIKILKELLEVKK